MLSPNSNWFYRLKGLTFLYVSVIAFLIITDRIRPELIQNVFGYSLFVIFGLWGLSYLFTSVEISNTKIRNEAKNVSSENEKTPTKRVSKGKKIKR